MSALLRICASCFINPMLYISCCMSLARENSTYTCRLQSIASAASYTHYIFDRTTDTGSLSSYKTVNQYRELALHWFCSQGNYYQFVPLPLITTSSQLQTQMQQSYMIQLWCPPLIYPFIMQRKVTKQHSTPHLQAIASTFLGHGQKLYAQLRRCMIYKQVFHFYNENLSKHTTAWLQPHILAEQSQRSFDMQKILRSSNAHSDHLFALYKLSNNRSTKNESAQFDQSAIQFRALPLPPSPRKLIIPLLSHKTFSQQTRQWDAPLTYKDIHYLTFNQTTLGSFNLLALQLPHSTSSLQHTAESA